MPSRRQTPHDGAGLSLGARRQNNHLLRRQAVDLVQRQQEPLGNLQVSQPLRHLHVRHHGRPGHGDLAPKLLGDVDHLLQPRDQRGEGGDDNAPLRLSEDPF